MYCLIQLFFKFSNGLGVSRGHSMSYALSFHILSNLLGVSQGHTMSSALSFHIFHALQYTELHFLCFPYILSMNTSFCTTCMTFTQHTQHCTAPHCTIMLTAQHMPQHFPHAALHIVYCMPTINFK